MDYAITLTPGTNGWAELKIGDFEASVSYLTDVPFDCLLAMEIVNEHGTDLTLSFDTEGKGDVKLIADEYSTFVIQEGEPATLTQVIVSKDEIMHCLYHQLKDNIELWANWTPDAEEILPSGEPNFKLRTNMIRLRLDTIGIALDEY